MTSLTKRFAAGRFALLLPLFLLFWNLDASAQTERVTLPSAQVSLSELFGEIERQTGLTVVLDAGTFTPDSRVDLGLREGSAAELLARALPHTRHAWQRVDNYLVVRTVSRPRRSVPVQPSRADFERDVAAHTRRSLSASATVRPEQVIIRYDTIRTEKPHSGIFDYPTWQTTPGFTKRAANTPFYRNTPPLFAVKTNLVWWAARGTLNIGGEIGLGKKTSLELSGGINRWNFEGSVENNKKLAHWVVKPEFRYWLCERFGGHFFGLHALYSKYNISEIDIPMLFEKEFRYEGKAYGAGIDYGYHLPFSKHWGVEFSAGVGAIRLSYKKFACEKCGGEEGRYQKTYFGPTELGVKLIFLIK